MSLHRRGNNFPKARSSSVISSCISTLGGAITRQRTATCAGSNESDSNDKSDGNSDGSSDGNSDGSSDGSSDGNSDGSSDGSSDHQPFAGGESDACAYGERIPHCIDVF